jgi:hypothetical protein
MALLDDVLHGSLDSASRSASLRKALSFGVAGVEALNPPPRRLPGG